MAEETPQARRNRRPLPPLNRDKARRLAVDRMTDQALWQRLSWELERGESKAAAYESREAFYALVRAQQIVDELYTRGLQLAMLSVEEFAKEARSAILGSE